MIEDLLGKYDWNLMFAHFPNFEDGNTYRVYKILNIEGKNLLLGAGKTPEEAIDNARNYRIPDNQ